MWIQATDQEFEAEINKERRSIIMPIAMFVIVQVGAFLTLALGMPDEYGYTHLSASLAEYVRFLPRSLLFGVGVGLLWFACNYFVRSYRHPKWLQCTHCGETITNTPEIDNDLMLNHGQHLCKCGGHFIDQRRLKWVDSPSQEIGKCNP
jgi:hypothetical protein